MFLEDRFQLAFDLKVEWHENRGFELLGQRLDIGPCLVIEIGDGKVRAEGTKSLGAAIGDRLIVGDARDESLLALEQR